MQLEMVLFAGCKVTTMLQWCHLVTGTWSGWFCWSFTAVGLGATWHWGRCIVRWVSDSFGLVWRRMWQILLSSVLYVRQGVQVHKNQWGYCSHIVYLLGLLKWSVWILLLVCLCLKGVMMQYLQLLIVFQSTSHWWLSPLLQMHVPQLSCSLITSYASLALLPKSLVIETPGSHPCSGSLCSSA